MISVVECCFVIARLLPRVAGYDLRQLQAFLKHAERNVNGLIDVCPLGRGLVIFMTVDSRGK